MDSLFPPENEDGHEVTRQDSMSTMHKDAFPDLFENNPSYGSFESYFNLDPCYGLDAS